MNKDLLIQYAKLKEQARAIAAAIDELNPSITKMMLDEGADEVKVDGMKFYLTHKRTWVYPDAIKRAEEDLKVAKETAEQTGAAQYTEKPVLNYRSES